MWGSSKTQVLHGPIARNRNVYASCKQSKTPLEGKKTQGGKKRKTMINILEKKGSGWQWVNVSKDIVKAAH